MRRILLLTVVVAFGCGTKSSPPPKPKKPLIAPDTALAALQGKDIPPGLDMRLSNGKQGAPGFDHAKLAPAKKLGPQQIDALLARAKPLEAEPDDQQAFALRPASQPPPKTGTIVKDTFPAPPSSLLPPKASDAGKDLQVLRYMPEGQVKLAPELSVTFSQPMIAVTSQDAAAKSVPVKLTRHRGDTGDGSARSRSCSIRTSASRRPPRTRSRCRRARRACSVAS